MIKPQQFHEFPPRGNADAFAFYGLGFESRPVLVFLVYDEVNFFRQKLNSLINVRHFVLSVYLPPRIVLHSKQLPLWFQVYLINSC